MPYVVRKTGPPSQPYCVYKQAADGEPTGESLGCHATEAEANKQLAALYVHVPDARKDMAMDTPLFWLGDPVKSLGEPGRVGGYLIRFGSPDQPDQSTFRDYFTKSTDYGHDEWPARVPILFHHGMAEGVGLHRIGTGELKMDDDGIFVEAVLKAHDAWARRVLLAMQRKSAVTGLAPLRWSSGSADHLMRREPVKAADGSTSHWLKSWFLAEASLTPTPAEHRCHAFSLKSLGQPDVDQLLEPEPLPLADHVAQVAAANADLAERVESRLEARIKAGRELSQGNRAEIEGWLGSLAPFHPLHSRITDLLARTAPAGQGAPVVAVQPAEPAAGAQGAAPGLGSGAGSSPVTGPPAGVLLPDMGDLLTSMANRMAT